MPVCQIYIVVLWFFDWMLKESNHSYINHGEAILHLPRYPHNGLLRPDAHSTPSICTYLLSSSRHSPPQYLWIDPSSPQKIRPRASSSPTCARQLGRTRSLPRPNLCWPYCSPQIQCFRGVHTTLGAASATSRASQCSLWSPRPLSFCDHPQSNTRMEFWQIVKQGQYFLVVLFFPQLSEK